MKLQKKIDKIFPYMDKNFITYPLIEEGNNIPFINFWQIFNNENEYKKFKKHFKKYKKKYKLTLVEVNNKVHNFEIYPKYDYNDEKGFYSLHNYSIEEMLDIISDMIENKSKTIIYDMLLDLNDISDKPYKKIVQDYMKSYSNLIYDRINEKIIDKNLQ